MRKDFWLIGVSIVAIFFSSTTFLDATTYPKLIALTLLFLCLGIVRNLRIKRTSFFVALLIWNLIFVVHLVFFGYSQKTNILLGYPGRNLGLLSLLLGILTLSYFKSVRHISSLSLLFISSSLISLSSFIAEFLHDPPLLLAQFSYSFPSSLNQNIITLFLTLGVISGIGIIIENKFHFFYSMLIISFIAINLFALWRIGDFQAFLYLGVLTFVTSIIAKVKYRFLKKSALLLPFVIAPISIFLGIQNLTTIRENLGLSIVERLEIASITLGYVSKNPISFRLPDTTADLEKRTSIQGFNQFIDNAHNVFIEWGIYLGWIPMVLMFFSITVFFASKIIQLSDSLLPKGEKIYLIASLQVIYSALFITILHPITIFAISISLSLVLSKIVGHKKEYNFPSISELMKIQKTSRPLIRVLSGTRALSRLRRFVAIFLLLVPLLLITQDVGQKINFRKLETNLILGRVEPKQGIAELTSKSLTMSDRQYLNYVGRQLATIGDCKNLREIIDGQYELDIRDFPSYLLRQWFRQNCPYG